MSYSRDALLRHALGTAAYATDAQAAADRRNAARRHYQPRLNDLHSRAAQGLQLEVVREEIAMIERAIRFA